MKSLSSLGRILLLALMFYTVDAFGQQQFTLSRRCPNSPSSVKAKVEIDAQGNINLDPCLTRQVRINGAAIGTGGGNGGGGDNGGGGGSAVTSVAGRTGAVTLAAADILSGTFAAGLIPNLDTGKITTGVFTLDRIPILDDARIPNFNASKIAAGVFGSARIPNLDAAKITTGVFDPARIGNLDASKITSGTFNAALIPILDATRISGVLDPSQIPVLTADKLPEIDASQITTGVFDPARIGNLDASKITTGVFDSKQIGTLDANKITSGVFDPARIGNLDAGQITTGVLPSAQIANLDTAKITTGVFDIGRIPVLDPTRIPNLDAAKITTGKLAVERIPVLDRTQIPNLDTGQITSGTFNIARLPITGATNSILKRTATGIGAARIIDDGDQISLGNTVGSNVIYQTFDTTNFGIEQNVRGTKTILFDSGFTIDAVNFYLPKIGSKKLLYIDSNGVVSGTTPASADFINFSGDGNAPRSGFINGGAGIKKVKGGGANPNDITISQNREVQNVAAAENLAIINDEANFKTLVLNGALAIVSIPGSGNTGDEYSFVYNGQPTARVNIPTNAVLIFGGTRYAAGTSRRITADGLGFGSFTLRWINATTVVAVAQSGAFTVL